MTLTPKEQKDFLSRGFSRRTFGRIATMITAGSTLPFYNEPALAQLSKIDNIPADAVIINANENPLGPSPEDDRRRRAKCSSSTADAICTTGNRQGEGSSRQSARVEAGR